MFRERIKQKGEFIFFLEMYDHDHETFHHYFRMIPSKFYFLLSKVGICCPHISSIGRLLYNKHGNCLKLSVCCMSTY